MATPGRETINLNGLSPEQQREALQRAYDGGRRNMLYIHDSNPRVVARPGNPAWAPIADKTRYSGPEFANGFLTQNRYPGAVPIPAPGAAPQAEPQAVSQPMQPQQPMQAAAPGASRRMLQPDQRGRINPNDLYYAALERVQNHGLNGMVPRDGARFGIKTGSPQEWAHYLTQLAAKESSYNTRTVGDVGYFPGNSNGLFQLSPNDSVTYGLNRKKPFSIPELQDPNINLDATLDIKKGLLDKHGSMVGGVSRYWGPLKRGWAPKPYTDGMYGQGGGNPAPAGATAPKPPTLMQGQTQQPTPSPQQMPDSQIAPPPPGASPQQPQMGTGYRNQPPRPAPGAGPSPPQQQNGGAQWVNGTYGPGIQWSNGDTSFTRGPGNFSAGVLTDKPAPPPQSFQGLPSTLGAPGANAPKPVNFGSMFKGLFGG